MSSVLNTCSIVAGIAVGVLLLVEGIIILVIVVIVVSCWLITRYSNYGAWHALKLEPSINLLTTGGESQEERVILLCQQTWPMKVK